MNNAYKALCMKAMVFVFSICSMLLTSEMALASASASDTDIDSHVATKDLPIIKVLDKVTTTLTSGIAQGIATVAIFTVGAGLFMGKINWPTALATSVGVGIIFGAGKITNWISQASSST